MEKYLNTHPEAWNGLIKHHEEIKKTHLGELLKDEARNKELLIQHSDIVLDLTH